MRCSHLCILWWILILHGGLTIHVSSINAAEVKRDEKLALPGEPCQIPPHQSWSHQEQWVWNQVCEGKIADFNTAYGYGGKLDPKDQDWPDERVLKPDFLETILLNETWRSAVPRQGVRIIGAWFKGSLDLSDAELAHILQLAASRFDLPVHLSRLRTPYDISFDGSVVMCGFAMDNMRVGGNLFMRDGASFAQVILRGAQIEGQVSMSKATVTGNLDMDGLHVAGGFFMRDGTSFARVILRGAQIGGPLDMSKATVKGELNMDAMRVGGDLFMRDGASFAQVILRGAQIEGQLGMSKATVKGELNMNAMRVGSDLFMRDGASFAQVILRGAQIGGQLDMSKATVKGELDMDTMRVGNALHMINGNFTEASAIYLTFVTIGSNLALEGQPFQHRDLLCCKISHECVFFTLVRSSSELNFFVILRDSPRIRPIHWCSRPLLVKRLAAHVERAALEGSQDLPSLDLTGTTIGGELRLTWEATVPKWQSGAQLTLRNTKVGALHEAFMVKQSAPKTDEWKAWPDKLELGGFTYDSLGGLQTQGEAEMADRPVSWFKDWLKKQLHYTPQPYEQLAKVLRNTGHKDKATAILYASKRREHTETLHWWQPAWWGLTIQWLFIGYGYYNFLALVWIIVFCIIGTILLCWSGEGPCPKSKWRNAAFNNFIYSMDKMLPVIHLEKKYENITLQSNLIRLYFYFIYIMGYLLISLYVAGLTGLIKQ